MKIPEQFGSEISEELVYIPAKIMVIEHEKKKTVIPSLTFGKAVNSGSPEYISTSVEYSKSRSNRLIFMSIWGDISVYLYMVTISSILRFISVRICEGSKHSHFFPKLKRIL